MIAKKKDDMQLTRIQHRKKNYDRIYWSFYSGKDDPFMKTNFLNLGKLGHKNLDEKGK